VLRPRPAGLSVCPRVAVVIPDRPPDRARVGHDPAIRGEGRIVRTYPKPAVFLGRCLRPVRLPSIAGVPATSVAPPAAARRHPVQRELQVGGLLAGDPPDKLLERVRVGLARVDHVPEVEESGEATPSRQRHLDHGMLPGPQPAAGDSEPEGIQGLRRS